MSHLTAEFNSEAERHLYHEFVLWLLFCLILDGEGRKERTYRKKRQQQLAARFGTHGYRPR